MLIDPAQLLPFLLLTLALEATPGPNMAFLALVSATRGRRFGFAMVAGVTLGLSIIGVLAASGAAVVISQSPVLLAIMKYAGVAYLVWLALTEWRAAHAPTGETGTQKAVAFFRHGLIVNLLNPKAGVFFITLLPSFISEAMPALPQSLTLTAIYVAIATGAHSGIVIIGATLRPWLADAERQTRVRQVFAVILGLIALWVATKS